MNNIVLGKNDVSEVVLRLFKLILTSETPDKMTPKRESIELADEPVPYQMEGGTPEELMRELDRFDPQQREALIRALRDVVRAAAQRRQD